MPLYYDIHHAGLKKTGEELCGDRVKISRAGKRTIAVLSDGLGSGVKANILATLTSEIVGTMIREGMPFQEVITTVIGTLPECRERRLAYATFTVLDIDEESREFKVINFDNPPVMLFRKGRLCPLSEKKEIIQEKFNTAAKFDSRFKYYATSGKDAGSVEEPGTEEGTLKGVVAVWGSKPGTVGSAEGMNVFLDGKNGRYFGTVDAKNWYTISAPPGDYTLIIDAVGYRYFEKKVTVVSGRERLVGPIGLKND